ncbi:MAG: AAA family ATPase [Alphaproteobacteria bacterium]|nr:AAA family ATPase [Alphaproteobacteria bacterium]
MPDWQERLAELERVNEDRFEPETGDYADETQRIRATPFGWPDPAKIPRRRWLFGHWLLRGEVTAIVAPGGVGKSTFTAGVALSLASGQDFLDKALPEGACTVWLWNLEDDRAELDRQFTACSLRHAVGPQDCGSRLYVDSGLDQRLCTAIEVERGLEIVEPVYANLKAEIEARGIDVLTVDPFVSSHEIDENANVLIDKVAKRWKRLASETQCSIVLVHHTKKMGGREVRAEDSRGAVALINAARSTLVLNPMSNEEAERFGITEKAERRTIIRVDDDKPNRAPPENAWWMKLESVDLGNGDGLQPSDHVGAATHWTPPDPFDGLNTRDLYNVQLAIDAGAFAENVQSKDWAGSAVAETLGFDLEDRAQKERVKSLIRTWKHNGALKVERRHDGKRERPYLIVGEWVDPTTLSTSQSGVEKVEKVGVAVPPEHHSTTTFLKVGGGGGGLTEASESEVENERA